MSRLILPAATAVFLLLFYLGLPDLCSASISLSSPQAVNEFSRSGKKTIDRTDVILILCITVFFGFVDFYGLGNKTSIESFSDLGGKSAVFTFDRPSVPVETDFFTGVGYGEYTFSYSAYATSSQFCQYRHNLLERFLKKSVFQQDNVSLPLNLFFCKDMKLYAIIQIITTFFVSTVLGVDEICIFAVDMEKVLEHAEDKTGNSKNLGKGTKTELTGDGYEE